MLSAGFFTALFYLGNLLFAVSYAVKEMLPLRVLSVCAGLAATPYFVFRDEPLWSAVLWQAVYMSINGVHIVRLLLDRRPVDMTPEQERVHFRVFPTLRPREFLRLMDWGSPRTLQPGEVLITDGADVAALSLVMRGDLSVDVDGRAATISAGHFAGELSLVRRATARGTVRAGDHEVGCVSWSHEQLRELKRKDAGLERALQDAISRDLANKMMEPR
jgi:hypothetical protein